MSCFDQWNQELIQGFTYEQEWEQAYYQESAYHEEPDSVCVCEECGDPDGRESRGNLCYDCELAWQEYQVRHYSFK
jgi:hypothetical protein